MVSAHTIVNDPRVMPRVFCNLLFFTDLLIPLQKITTYIHRWIAPVLNRTAIQRAAGVEAGQINRTSLVGSGSLPFRAGRSGRLTVVTATVDEHVSKNTACLSTIHKQQGHPP
jgi:hypothetical protein